jgi:hypothetical protein
MEGLAERTERLVKYVQDWPLGVAIDYLIDQGCSVLEDLQIGKRARVARLKRRLKAVAREMIGQEVENFELLRDVRGARVRFWWNDHRPDVADALCVCLHAPSLLAVVTRTWRESRYYFLRDWWEIGSGEFPERSICDLFVLLWCVARCYAGD